jgi:hypothetical protein
MFRGQISAKTTSTISIVWNFTTQSDGIWHLLLELERSDLFLLAQWVVFPFDVVQLQLMLHAIESLLLLELVELPLCLVELLHAWRCGEIGATGCLIPQLVELLLRLIALLGALEILQLFALGELVDLFLLGHGGALLSELGSRRPAGGKSQKKGEQQQTYNNGPQYLHRRTSLSL